LTSGGVGGMTQVIEHLPSKHEALISNSSKKINNNFYYENDKYPI
jgi:hypothetical protein